jgi:hypothetical protein
MKRDRYEFLQKTGTTFNLPIYLESTVDEMGVMVGFNGEVEQVEQLVNFSYSGVTNTKQVVVYSTVNPDKFRKIVDQEFTIEWGDGTSGSFPINAGILGTNLPTTGHTYSVNGSYDITVKMVKPWTVEKTTKTITVPFKNPTSITNPLGSFSGVTMPVEIDYLNDLDYTNNTGHTTFTYMSIGRSRIDEFKKYGSTSYSGITTGTTDGSVWSGYTIDGLYYRDYSDGYTMITGNTTGYTKEEVFNLVLTRNEHFLGFVDEPTIYSDVFVERGKQGVMEKNLRLGEIDNMGEIDVYGNGYFKVRKQ